MEFYDAGECDDTFFGPDPEHEVREAEFFAQLQDGILPAEDEWLDSQDWDD